MDDNVDHHATVAPLTTDWKVSKLRYEKIHKHASGGLGAVFLAHDLEVSRNLKTALLLGFVALTTFCAIIAKYYFIKI